MRIRLFFLIAFMNTTIFFAQNDIPYTFGGITQDEYDLTMYSKDSSANAVVLYEYGTTKFHKIGLNMVIRRKHYSKVKIFNKEGVQNATIKIPIYNTLKEKEKVFNVRATTHNGLEKTSLDQKNIFVGSVTNNWAEVKFTMPNVKDNSIIEYEYTLESPFIFNFKGWEFQSDIPKIHTEFYALIPGNYLYNRSLRGYLKLSKNIVNVKRKCFSVDYFARTADCEELIYAMKHVPAFVEEDFLTKKENYLSAIKFELSQFKDFDGNRKKYTKNWRNVDKEFRKERSIGKQLKKIDYLKNHLPKTLLKGGINLVNAKNIYYFIQDHFSWNEQIKLFSNTNGKDVYLKKVGNSTEINISLINALNAAGFDAQMVLLSTRNNGLPTKLYPVLSEFNYAIVKLNIEGNSYLLDATTKNMPFNMLPFRTLNSYGRVMDFRKGSYWYPLEAKSNNITRTSLNLKMEENGNFIGQMQKSYDGYRAMTKRTDINKLDKEEYISKAEETFGIDDNLVINAYTNTNVANIEKPLKELYDVTIENDSGDELIIFNPFFDGETSVNPFKLNKRSYPVDFGYATTNLSILQLTIPDNYIVKSLPKNKGLKLPNDGGQFTFSIIEKDNKIQMTFKAIIKRSLFTPHEYPYLKEFFNQIIKTQKSLITLEKK